MLAEKLSGGAATDVTYVDDVFSTYLYTGNGSTQTITNGIDLAGKGGLVWQKMRTDAGYNNYLIDTVRGVNKLLQIEATGLQQITATSVTAFNSNGFGISNSGGYMNVNSKNEVSWTFRKAANFFDVVTWTGTGSARTIAHNLGSTPGCIIVKRTDTTGNWQVYHNGLTSAAYSIQLNLTSAQSSATTVWNSTAPTSSVFSVGTDATVNASGGTYVAYLFAHDTSSTGLIQCGSVTTSTSPVTVNLGYEPQWILVKNATNASFWYVYDTMRGVTSTFGGDLPLYPNSSSEESTASSFCSINATGFSLNNGFFASGSNVIYIAIRRPNKPPTSGTQVYNGIARTGTGAAANVTGVGFAIDLAIIRNRTNIQDNKFSDRLRGIKLALVSDSAAAEGTDTQGVLGFDVQDGISLGTDTAYNKSATGMINYFFKRAPGFFDVVCWTGTGGAPNITHNLGDVPQLLIQKIRGTTGAWYTQIYLTGLNAYGTLNTTSAFSSLGSGNIPTTTTFVPLDNTSGYGFVAYLFATLAGISKVGSYTGNGTSQTINCGFAAGARFILIKRTDSTGDWKVIDSARGIVAGNDPTLALNSTAAEVTGTDCIDPDSSGFIVNQESTNNLNVNSATYIYLAIA